jgi:FkbM family methyltransferase
MVSYAQNFEDVMIQRLFEPGHLGFYLDIGAAHPEKMSVTCHFYKNGWSGVNVEPVGVFHALLQEARPRDVNLRFAVGDTPGASQFFEISGQAENSTLNPEIATALEATGATASTTMVEVIRLDQLCDRFVGSRTIDFLKIDTEGGELSVLRSGDWARYRPRLVVIEAVAVNSSEENWLLWEPILVEADYHRVWFDGLNNFYLRGEDLALQQYFRTPPNVLDRFQTAHAVSLSMQLEAASARNEVLDAQAVSLSLQLEAASARNEALDAQAVSLTMQLEAASARNEVLDAQAVSLSLQLEAASARNEVLDAVCTERLKLIKKLETAGSERLQLIEELILVCDERMKLIEDLTLVGSERLQLIEELNLVCAERLELIEELDAIRLNFSLSGSDSHRGGNGV